MSDGREQPIDSLSFEDCKRLYDKCWCAKGNPCTYCRLLKHRMDKLMANGTPLKRCRICGESAATMLPCLEPDGHQFVDRAEPALVPVVKPAPPTVKVEPPLSFGDVERLNAEITGVKQANETVKRLAPHLAELLKALGANAEACDNTPARFCKALIEMTCGGREDPREILSKQFEEKSDELVLLRGIGFSSLCEHHLLPFVGVAHVGYLPGSAGRVVGLSKLARLVECFACRLQLQERMTRQIAEALSEHLDAYGAAVVVEARHSCMACRGVRKATATMVTSSMLGAFREDRTLRAEFLRLCREGE